MRMALLIRARSCGMESARAANSVRSLPRLRGRVGEGVSAHVNCLHVPSILLHAPPPSPPPQRGGGWTACPARPFFQIPFLNRRPAATPCNTRPPPPPGGVVKKPLAALENSFLLGERGIERQAGRLLHDERKIGPLDRVERRGQIGGVEIYRVGCVIGGVITRGVGHSPPVDPALVEPWLEHHKSG